MAIVYKVIDADYKSINEGKRVLWHKVSAEIRDRMGDVIRIDGLDTSNFQKKPGVLYGHNYTGLDPVPVIGANLGFERRGKFLYAGTRFLNPEKDKLSAKLGDLVNDLWTLNKMNLMGWSVGFIPLETASLKENGKVVGQDYKRSELLEYSNVIIPANQEAVNDAMRKGIVTPMLKEFGGGLRSVSEDEIRFANSGKVGPEGRREIRALYEKSLAERLRTERLRAKANQILPAGERFKFRYKFVGENELSEYRLREAYKVLQYCREKLKLPDLKLSWIVAVREEDAYGIAFDTPIGGCASKASTIHIRADIPLNDIKFAIAHEAHHLWFGRTYGKTYPIEGEQEMWEQTANAFAEIVLLELIEKEFEAQANRETLSLWHMSRR
jgi:hypothetical protein